MSQYFPAFGNACNVYIIIHNKRKKWFSHGKIINIKALEKINLYV